MAYKRTAQCEVIDRDGLFTAGGCASYSIENAGNTDVVIFNVKRLKPTEEFEGPTENPDVKDYTTINVSFFGEVASGLPPGPLDQRVIITKTFITKD